MKVTRSDDRLSAAIELDDEHAIALGTKEVDALLAELIAARQEMLPAVPLAPPPDIKALLDVRFRVMPHPIAGGCLIAARHPGAGWLFLHASAPTCLEMSSILGNPPDSQSAPTTAH